MIRNKALDFIIQQIQWGEVKAGSKFFSERELALKLNISKSTAKNALNFAESIHLLKSKKGSYRIVEDFTDNVFLEKYLTIKRKKMDVIKTAKYNKNDMLIFNKYFKYKMPFFLKIDLLWKNEKIATFYSSTKNKSLYNSFLNAEGTFLDFLKINQIIIEKIKEKIFYDNQHIFVQRLLFNTFNQLLEEGILMVSPQYFSRKRAICFFYSKKMKF